MRSLAMLLLALVLGACASTPAQEGPATLFADARFGTRPNLPTRDAIFALGDDMRARLHEQVRQRARGRNLRTALYETVTALKLEYDTAVTRTASETFAAGAGNCLSLVILSGALAEALDVPVVYQSVHGFDTWSRDGGIAFLSGHVNLMLGSYAPASDFSALMFDRSIVIDFVEDARSTLRRSRPVGESMIVAMFHNNHAAEALLAGRGTDAYWFAREAIIAEPTFVSAYNTLAVVYRRHGLLREAARALDFALAREPGNPQMLTNLVAVLEGQGRSAEAAVARQRLAAVSEHPPFWFLDRGNEALERGDPEAALAWYQREMERIPYDHELHFAVAIASARRGDLRDAQTHLQLAHENSTSRERRAIYAAKLKHLAIQAVH